MVNILKLLTVSALITLANVAVAGSQTADFTNYGRQGHTYNQITDSTGKVNATAWADTGGRKDNKIEQARYLARYYGGWGITNRDGGDGHTADNYSGGNDYDFFLVDFTHSVNLTGATFGYLTSGNLGVSYAALDESKFSGSLTGLTWQQVASNLYSTGSGSSAITRNANNTGYFINNNVGSTSRYWLIGAFNSVFGSLEHIKHGGFKLETVSFTKKLPTTEVSEPSVLLVFGLALIALAGRRVKKA